MAHLRAHAARLAVQPAHRVAEPEPRRADAALVRQVRAVSCEEHEAAINDATLGKCLRIAVKDACASGLAGAFNDYLDLGAGVPILWYARRAQHRPAPAATPRLLPGHWACLKA